MKLQKSFYSFLTFTLILSASCPSFAMFQDTQPGGSSSTTRSATGMEETAFTQVMDSLATAPVIRATSLSSNQIQRLAVALKENTVVREFHINGISAPISEDATALATMLRVNSTLETFTFSWGHLNDELLEILAAGLIHNHSLRTLDLSVNKIGNTGAQVLAAVLLGNPSLRSLNLSDNCITEPGADAIAVGLQESSLEMLNLGGNKIGNNGVRALAEILRDNNHLFYLSLDGCEIGNAGAEALTGMLYSNSTLQILSLKNNEITNRGAEALGKSFKRHPTLEELLTDGNEITDGNPRGWACSFQLDKSLGDIVRTSWKAPGVVIEAHDDGSQILTTNKAGGYQVMETVHLGDGKAVKISYALTVAEGGNVSIGLLNFNESSWLGQKAFSAGSHTGTLPIPTPDQKKVTFIIQSNTRDSSSQVIFNNLEVLVRE